MTLHPGRTAPNKITYAIAIGALAHAVLVSGTNAQAQNKFAIREATTFQFDIGSAEPIEKNCGIGCVYLAIKALGGECGIEKLTAEFDVTSTGFVDLGQCSKVLRDYGLDSRGFETTRLEDIFSFPSLAILPVRESATDEKESHFVLLFGADEETGELHFATPEEYLRMPFEDFQEQWLGKFMLVSEDSQIIDDWLSSKSTPGARISTILAWVLCGATGIMLIVFWVGRRQAQH